MAADNKPISLAADIAGVLSRRRYSLKGTRRFGLPSRYLLATGVALAIMQTQPAQAVALGELRVQSGLGQPLIGTTTARLGPGETISSACITAPAVGTDGLSSPAGIRIKAPNGASPGDYPIQIRTTQPLYEPMYELRLQIDCPGGVTLSKSYVVMLNVPMSAPVEPVVRATASPRELSPTLRSNGQPRNNPSINRPATASRARTTSSNNRLAPAGKSVVAGEAYRVRNGDTLSTIAERVTGRPAGSIWRVADMLYAANPQAFIRGNRDMIKLGAVLTIPTVSEMTGDIRDAGAGVTVGNSLPTSSGDQQAKAEPGEVEPGRPEDVVTSDVTQSDLLREIRETNIAEAGPDRPESAESISAAEPVSPFADDQGTAATATTAIASTNFSSGEALTVAGAAAVAEDNKQNSGMSPLTAALGGVFMGMLLALLMLGRHLLTPLLQGRARRKAALAHVTAAAPVAAAADAATAPEVSISPVRPAYGGGGIDVEISERDTQDAPAGVDVDLFADDTATVGQQSNAPRISLHSDANPDTDTAHIDSLFDNLASDRENDETDRLETLTLNAPPQPQTSGSEEIEADTLEMLDNSESPTAELPAVDKEDTADTDITDLAALSRKLQETQDDDLSATLTQALGLLEQDYESAMSASQILEQQEVDEAFSQHKSED